jgi:hypothetical protein
MVCGYLSKPNSVHKQKSLGNRSILFLASQARNRVLGISRECFLQYFKQCTRGFCDLLRQKSSSLHLLLQSSLVSKCVQSPQTPALLHQRNVIFRYVLVPNKDNINMAWFHVEHFQIFQNGNYSDFKVFYYKIFSC